MNTNALLQPQITDRESLQEFADNLTDQIPHIERDIARLERTPGDKALIADLFRALHNIKGDASISQVELGVMIAHPVETLLSRLRTGEVIFTDLLAEVVLLAMDRLELAVEALVSNRPLMHLKLVELVGGLEKIAAVAPAALAEDSARLIEAVTGFRPARHKHGTLPDPSPKPHSPATEAGPGDTSADLHFFRSLALQFEARSPLFQGRSERLLKLARDTNLDAGNPVDPLQLEAAVYFHDIGMMFLPEQVWLKAGKLSEQNKLLLQGHPIQAAALMQRMPGWQGAAEMVAQHHEMPDGGGYPEQLKNGEICAGAKILAIVDAFEAVTLKHGDRGRTRSIVRAIAEVNACDNQFAPEWIASFNAVIRRLVET
ncbi:MAG: HD domain-containing protein [Betaproteobacteria bacterium]|nr:HD domain-containing protein [Betaproteobacteria bacterium]